MYSALHPPSILKTLERLQARIDERFPESGLGRVCAELIDTARQTADKAAALARPDWRLRGAVMALIAAGLAAQIAAARFLHVSVGDMTATELAQGLEAAVNLLILFGGAVWFLLTLEERLKRRRALEALHQLRQLAHVIDMHQLTKDPTIILAPHKKTSASPARAMSRFELTRYLDYCAEMLALIGKLAALYGENARDGVIIDAINDIENLTGNLGRKIWQKITIIGVLEERD
ncbi:MAG: hypothetical protein ABUS48_04370 [Pseudomonadota bacterium]